MAVTIDEVKKVTIHVNDVVLEEGKVYTLLMNDGKNEIGLYEGFADGYLVFNPLLGERERKVRCSNLAQAKLME